MTKVRKRHNAEFKSKIGVSTEFGPYRAVRNFVEF